MSIFDEYVKFHYRSGGEHFQLIFMRGDTKSEPELRKFYLLEENSIFLIVCVCVCGVYVCAQSCLTLCDPMDLYYKNILNFVSK